MIDFYYSKYSLFKACEYDDGESISLINYFSIIDMEGPFMGYFLNQVSIRTINS
jgi:hypothetical protein